MAQQKEDSLVEQRGLSKGKQMEILLVQQRELLMVQQMELSKEL